MKILVPDTIPLDFAELRDADAELDPVGYRVAEPVPEEHVDAEVLVAWSNPPGPLADAARRLTKLRWVQDLAAGPGVTLQAGFPAEVVITSGRSLHDRTVAEHALALTLAAARHLHVAVRAQIGHRWASEIGGLQPLDNAQGFTTLRDANVVIWGFGGIARTLAPLYTALGANVVGVARTPRTDGPYPVVDDVDAVLPTADVLVNILPTAPATDRVRRRPQARPAPPEGLAGERGPRQHRRRGRPGRRAARRGAGRCGAGRHPHRAVARRLAALGPAQRDHHAARRRAAARSGRPP